MIKDKYGEEWPDIKVVAEYDRPEAAERHTKRLQEYDKYLFAKWLWPQNRWGIMTRDKRGKEYLVFVVENEDKTFRQIDNRVLIKLRKADLWRRRKKIDLLREIEEHNNNLEFQKARQLSRDCEAISKDDWRHIFSKPLLNIPVNMKALA